MPTWKPISKIKLEVVTKHETAINIPSTDQCQTNFFTPLSLFLSLSLSLKTKIFSRDSVFYKVNTYFGYIVGCVVDFEYFLFKYPVYNWPCQSSTKDGSCCRIQNTSDMIYLQDYDFKHWKNKIWPC